MSGKLLGEGSYGCVFFPMLNCKEAEVLNKNVYQRMVSKVFTSLDESSDSIFEKEADLARLVNKLDPSGSYFGTPTKICKVPFEELIKHPAFQECEELNYAISTKPAALDQIVMPDYGLQLDTYLRVFKQLNRGVKYPANLWIDNIRNLLEGIKLLQQYKYVHMDIKHSNILFDNKTMRLIDFSLVKTFDEVYLEKYKSRLSYDYLPYPFEFPFVYYNKYSNDTNIFSYYKLNLLAFDNTTYKTYLGLYDTDTFKAEQILKKESENLQRWLKETPEWFDIVKQNVDKIDIYSIGITCLFLHNEIDFSKITNKEYVNYMQFLKKLTQMDFRERPNINTALELHTGILS